MQQLSKMTGCNEPERVEVSDDTLSRYIIELRKEPIFGGGRVIDLERPALENGENGKGVSPESRAAPATDILQAQAENLPHR